MEGDPGSRVALVLINLPRDGVNANPVSYLFIDDTAYWVLFGAYFVRCCCYVLGWVDSGVELFCSSDVC